jgi:hypothetical protein
MRISRYSAWLFLALPVAASAQIPQEPLVRITVNLVQVEAVVTGSKGRPVSNLTADDFQIFQDGKTADNFRLFLYRP